MFILCVFTSSVTSLLMTLVFAARSGGGIAARVGGSGGGGGGRICEVPSFAMNVKEAIDVAQHWNFFFWKCAAFLAACGAQPEDARQSLQYALLPSCHTKCPIRKFCEIATLAWQDPHHACIAMGTQHPGGIHCDARHFVYAKFLEDGRKLEVLKWP